VEASRPGWVQLIVAASPGQRVSAELNPPAVVPDASNPPSRGNANVTSALRCDGASNTTPSGWAAAP
ncbi:MAG: hypothetical protein ABJA86_13610, partial [Nocardioidaceae bacterium]